MSYNHSYQQQADRKQMTKQFNEANSLKKAANDTQFFWDMVNKNKFNSYHSNPRKSSKQEERVLFGKKVENTERGEIDDNIPVERSGPQSDAVGVLQTFAELEGRVPSYVSSNIALMKYEKPTPIQKHSIPLGLAGLDLMCCAQTGSGKTFAFLLPVVARLDAPKEPQPESSAPVNPEPPRSSIDNRGALPRCIILAPTRELASQIHLDARRLIYTSKLKAVCVYGGNDLRTQLIELSTGCDIIVATPGRLNDLVDRGCVSLSEVCFFVLDEADRMLDMGFEPQIRRIVAEYDMPRREDRQTFMFSATFPPEIQTLAREFLRQYVWIGVGRVGSTVENIKQNILLSSSNPQEKMKLLIGAISETEGRTLVFVQKRMTATWLCQTLNQQFRINADEIHGDRTQSQREHALRSFRDGYTRILVATDVAARGLDVPAVTHVIQFDMPQSPEDFDVYVHRIGRTGRAGHSGVATSFYVPGREVGEGNGKIASLILRLLQENNQEIPEWFLNLDDLRYSGGGGNGRFSNNYRKPYNNGGGYQGNHYNNHSNNGGGSGKFGWRDVRNYTSSTTYVGSANGNTGAGAAGGAAYDHHNQGYQHSQPSQTQHQYQGNRGATNGGYYQGGRGAGAYSRTNYDSVPYQQSYAQPGQVAGYEHDVGLYAEGYAGGYDVSHHLQPQYETHMMQGGASVYDPHTGAYYDQYSGAYIDPMTQQMSALTLSPQPQHHSPHAIVAQHPGQQQHQQHTAQWMVPPPAPSGPVPNGSVPATSGLGAGRGGAGHGYRGAHIAQPAHPPAHPSLQTQHPQVVTGGYSYSHHPQSGGVVVDHQYGVNVSDGYAAVTTNGHYAPQPQSAMYANNNSNNQGFRTPLAYNTNGVSNGVNSGSGYNKYTNGSGSVHPTGPAAASGAVAVVTTSNGNNGDVMKDPQNMSA